MSKTARRANPITLNDTHKRLLQWLYSYPFQRLDDLVVSLSTWSGRTTIYTHLKELEQAQFVEGLKGPLGAGKRLYHLSPRGLAWYLARTQANQDTPETRNTATRREASARERAALVRLLPRTPALLHLQTAMNGLVLGAADALTLQGHRAHLVQWNWRRDAVHTFTFQGHTVRWFADGVGAFCLRYTPYDESAQEQWYRFFLLSTPLTHLHLMRARLDRLLRWREAKERWLTYTQMSPILILAESARQADWWFEAAERVAHDLGVMPPLGALASLPSLFSRSGSERTSARTLVDASLWHLPWKRLGSQRVCHLREMFTPQEDAGFPDLFPQETLREEQESLPEAPRRQVRLFQFERQREPRPKRRQERSASPDVWRRASLVLTPRLFELLFFLQAHPLLDRENLCAHLHLERSSVRHLLVPLVQAHLIQGYETRVGERFALAEDGLRLVAAASHCHVRALIHRPKGITRMEALVPRGVPGLLKQIEHLAGIYGFFDTLARFGCLQWWETGSICARFYQYQGDWHGIRPDAIAECFVEDTGDVGDAEGQTQRRRWRFFLEWDRGTMHERDLRRKMGAYARYLRSREWSREHQVPPALLCVVPDVGQERVLTHIAQASLENCAVRMTLYTTTQHLLLVPGLTAPIWRQVMPRAKRTADDPLLLRLFGPPRAEGAHIREPYDRPFTGKEQNT